MERCSCRGVFVAERHPTVAVGFNINTFYIDGGTNPPLTADTVTLVNTKVTTKTLLNIP